MVNVLPFLGPPREQRRQPQQKPTTGLQLPVPEPTLLQRVVGGGPARAGPPARAARGVLVPGQQLPHITLNTVQVRSPCQRSHPGQGP